MNSLLGDRIARARHTKGFTAKQLAQRLGVKASTVDNWESERSFPRANRLVQLAGMLNVPLVWLMAGADSPAEIDEPVLDETARIEEKLQRAELLVNELSVLLVEIRADTRWVQRELDAESV